MQHSLFAQDVRPEIHRWESGFIAFDKLDYNDYKRKILVSPCALLIEWSAEYIQSENAAVFYCYGTLIFKCNISVAAYKKEVLAIKDNPSLFADFANQYI